MVTIEDIEKKIKVLEEQKAKLVKEEKERKEAEKEDRRKEVDDAYNIYSELLHKYEKDYGCIYYDDKEINWLNEIFNNNVLTL